MTDRLQLVDSADAAIPLTVLAPDAFEPWLATQQADVQGWINNPAANFGWIVQGNEVTLQSVKRFDSREAGAATRPQLTVVYTPAPSNPADLNNDGVVNGVDLATLLGAWGTAGPGDINGSGSVNAADLAALLSAWTGA